MPENKSKPIILFKVLYNMKSCNGGEHTWELGKKYTVKEKLELCQRGFHLTTNPEKWIAKGNAVFFAEAFEISAWEDDKCVCKSVRLLKSQDPNGINKKHLAEYQPKRDAIDAEYQPKWKAIDAEYQTKWKAIDAEYQTKWDAIDAEYQPKRDAIDAEYQTKWKAIDAEKTHKLSLVIAEMASICFPEET